jgi:hypothetical protein
MDSHSAENQPTAAEKRKAIVTRQLNTLIKSNPGLYYEPTTTVARAVHEAIQSSTELSEEEHKVVGQLSVRDIELIFAFR